MTTAPLKLQTFVSAGWTKKTIAELEGNGCDALELVGRGNGEERFALQSNALKKMLAVVRIVQPGSALFAISGHECFQKLSRIGKHLGLWRGTPPECIGAQVSRMCEWMVEGEYGAAFFAIARISEPDSGDWISFFNLKKTSWLLSAPVGTTETELKNHLRNGWICRESFVPKTLYSTIKNMNCVLLRHTGAMDDSEAGAIAIGRKEEIVRLFGAFDTLESGT